jgi:hypothetical protein
MFAAHSNTAFTKTASLAGVAVRAATMTTTIKG